MTLDEWIRMQPSALPPRQRGGTPVNRSGGMTDLEFAQMLARRGLPAPTKEAVRLWRRRLREPNPQYAVRITEITRGAVTAEDMQKAKES